MFKCAVLRPGFCKNVGTSPVLWESPGLVITSPDSKTKKAAKRTISTRFIAVRHFAENAILVCFTYFLEFQEFRAGKCLILRELAMRTLTILLSCSLAGSSKQRIMNRASQATHLGESKMLVLPAILNICISLAIFGN